MKHVLLIPVLCVGLVGCSQNGLGGLFPKPVHLQNMKTAGQKTLNEAGVDAEMGSGVSSTSEPVMPPPDAITVGALDTASARDRSAAIASAPAETGALGVTIASIGDPTSPGFWLETSLVKSTTKGRVKSKATGRTVKVTLRPASGAAATGRSSWLSLSALQLLDLDLSGLHELVVYAD